MWVQAGNVHNALSIWDNTGNKCRDGAHFLDKPSNIGLLVPTKISLRSWCLSIGMQYLVSSEGKLSFSESRGDGVWVGATEYILRLLASAR